MNGVEQTASHECLHLELMSMLLAEEANLLPVSSVVFPLIAFSVFAVLGGILWSYRDVAHRHSNKTGGSARPGSGH